MIHALTQYYGVDLIATVLVLIAVYQIGNQQRSGFLWGVAGNVLWMIFGVLSGSAGIIIVNLVISVLYLRGYWNWGRR